MVVKFPSLWELLAFSISLFSLFSRKHFKDISPIGVCKWKVQNSTFNVFVEPWSAAMVINYIYFMWHTKITVLSKISFTSISWIDRIFSRCFDSSQTHGNISFKKYPTETVGGDWCFRCPLHSQQELAFFCIKVSRLRVFLRLNTAANSRGAKLTLSFVNAIELCNVSHHPFKP